MIPRRFVIGSLSSSTCRWTRVAWYLSRTARYTATEKTARRRIHFMYKLVLVRHGQSVWNLENRFTGWTDVGLTELGRSEAHAAGRMLREGGFVFDVAYTSVLKR